MRSLWKLLMVLLLAFSPCLLGCSSQMSEEAAEEQEEREEAEEEQDPADLDDDPAQE